MARRTGTSKRRHPWRTRRFRTGKPRRYGLLARYSDWRQAGLDAKARVPDPRADGQVVTQTLVVLEGQARDAAAAERRNYEKDTALHRVALARIQAEHAGALHAVQEAEARLREVFEPLSEDELTVRRPGDEHISEALVRERRRNERRRLISHAQRELALAEARYAALAEEAAALTAELRSRLDIARASVERTHEYMRRRRAAYWRRLVRRHPDGEQIDTLLRAELLRADWPDRPDWLNGDDEEPQT